MPLRHIALAVFLMMIWGGNFVAIKIGLVDFPPLLFLALRFVLTALPIVFFMSASPAPWLIIIAFGFTLGVAKFGILFVAMDMGVSAGIASVVLQSQAFFTIIFAAILLRERPEPRDWIGLAVAFLGIGLIAATIEQQAVLAGLLLTVVAGALWGAANLIMKRAGQVNMLHFIIYASLVPPLPLLALSYVFEGPQRISDAVLTMSFAGVAGVLYVVIGATLFGFAVWGFLLRSYPAAKVAPFTLLVPIFGMSSSALILGEEFGLLRLGGSFLVLLGLAIIFSVQLFTAIKQSAQKRRRSIADKPV